MNDGRNKRGSCCSVTCQSLNVITMWITQSFSGKSNYVCLELTSAGCLGICGPKASLTSTPWVRISVFTVPGALQLSVYILVIAFRKTPWLVSVLVSRAWIFSICWTSRRQEFNKSLEWLVCVLGFFHFHELLALFSSGVDMIAESNVMQAAHSAGGSGCSCFD